MTDLMNKLALSHVILRGEAIEAGYTDRDLANLVRAGQLHKLRHGAYVDGGLWREQDEGGRHRLLSRAVVRQSRTSVVLSHASAVPEYGGPLWQLPLEQVDVTRRDRRAGRRVPGVRQHQGLLLPADIRNDGEVDVASPTRTAIDITTVVGVEPALVVVNFLLHGGLTTLGEVRERYQAMERHPFTLRTDLVFRLSDPRIESVAESRFFHLAWRQGLPNPEPQFVIEDENGRVVARLDFAWPEHKVWVEIDGKEKYTKYLRKGETVADAVLREKQREDLIRELTGWVCIRITWADLFYPERVAARIRAKLGR